MVTISQIKGYAIGAMGMELRELERMRIGDLFLKLHFFFSNQDSKIRLNAELIRLQTLELININLKKGDKIKKPSQLWRYPWDEDKGSNVLLEMTVEQRKENIQAITDLLDG